MFEMDNEENKEQSNKDEQQDIDWFESIMKEEKLIQEELTQLRAKLDTYETVNAAINLEVKTQKDESNAIEGNFEHMHEFLQKAASLHEAFITAAQELYPNIKGFDAQLKALKEELVHYNSDIDQQIENVDAMLEKLEKEDEFWKNKLAEFDEAQFDEEIKEAKEKNGEEKKILSELQCELESMNASVKEQGDIKEQLMKDLEDMKNEFKALDEELFVASKTLVDIKLKTTGIEELQKAVDEAETGIQNLTNTVDEKQKIINELREKSKHDQLVNDGFERTIQELQDKYVALENEAKGYELQAEEIEKSASIEITKRNLIIADLETEINKKMAYKALLAQTQSELDALLAKEAAEISDLKNSLIPEDQQQQAEAEYKKQIELIEKKIENEENLLQDAQKKFDAMKAEFDQNTTEVETEIKSLTEELNAAKKLYEDTKRDESILNDECKTLSNEIEKNKLQLVILSKDEMQLLGKATQNALMDQHTSQGPPKKVPKHGGLSRKF